MAIALLLALVGAACTSAPGPAAPAPESGIPSPPPSFGARLTPAGAALAASPRACTSGEVSLSFEPDNSFTATAGEAEFSGRWEASEGDVLFDTEAPIRSDRCSFARWLSAGGGHVLVCAEGPLGCGLEATWVVEVVDLGAEPGGIERVAGVLTGIDEAYGPGMVVRGTGGATRGDGVTITYRAPPGGGASTRQLARHIADLVGTRLSTGRLKVVQDRSASSPVVVQVSGLVSIRR
ncbi:MAG: hypothetical protein KTR31_16240 [Myxococcales bacterium]|nr:hypothetical protein [Myxococcales bacterium]